MLVADESTLKAGFQHEGREGAIGMVCRGSDELGGSEHIPPVRGAASLDCESPGRSKCQGRSPIKSRMWPGGGGGSSIPKPRFRASAMSSKQAP